MKKTNEEYYNLIELLKQVLLFYGNKENYIEKPMNDGLISMIELDYGSQAKFALEKLKVFQSEVDEQEKMFVKNMIAAIEDNESQETLMGLIETYKTQTEDNEDKDIK